MEIVVCNLFRLGKDGDKFSKNFKTLLRPNAKLTRDYVDDFNKNWQVSGQLYEIDEKATKERIKKLNPVKEVEQKEKLKTEK